LGAAAYAVMGKQGQIVTHVEREIYAMQRMMNAHDNGRKDWSGRWWAVFAKLHKSRPQELVEQMEREKHLV
jgi:hypothetical protein